MTDKIKASLAEDPQLFASAGEGDEFHVIYLRFNKDRLLLTDERAIINRLTKQHPYCLYIFSNREQNIWHFTNVRLPDKEQEADNPLKRKLIRRIVIAQDENLRTAIERISLLAINSDNKKQAALSIQKQHDEAFDVEKITKQFYTEYKAMFQTLWKDLLKQTNDNKWAHDYSLQILNRLMFLYFIQRKRWMNDDPEWLSSFWKAYQQAGLPKDRFVCDWLSDLFFCAFNNRKVFLPERRYPSPIYQALIHAPYLNGGLFEENDLDKQFKYKFIVSDRRFEQVLGFLNNYNFTVREDSPLDQEVAVDAEMLGKVYESLVNVSTEIDERGEAGIFYTPRIEIDLMSRLSLVDNLANNIGAEHKNAFYEFVFAMDSEEKEAADKQISDQNLCEPVLKHLQSIKVVDPACGSGAFLVGMLLVVDDLIARAEALMFQKGKIAALLSAYDRRHGIIMNTLYGVDVMQWAVEIAELRLWLQLVIETEIPQAELGNKPLLPKLTFKIRRGDSLVQPVPSILEIAHNSGFRFSQSFINLRTQTERRKEQFFNNVISVDDYHKIETEELDLYRIGYQEIVQDCESRIFELKRAMEMQSINALGEIENDFNEKTRQKMSKELSELQAKLLLFRRYLNEVLKNENFFAWDKDFSEVFCKDQDGFDIVIGNPPYVRHEKISRPSEDSMSTTKNDKDKYKKELTSTVYSKYPLFFKHNEIPSNSDLYIYFYYLGLSLLNPIGSFCFITSNSWLDVGYGGAFQKFLLKTTSLKLIIDNNVKRSFSSADINTVISLLGKPGLFNDDGCACSHYASFVNFLVPFEEVESAVLFEEIDGTRGRKFTIEYQMNSLNLKDLYTVGCEMANNTDDLEYKGYKWGGIYLKAPEIYHKIIERNPDRLVQLRTKVDVFGYIHDNYTGNQYPTVKFVKSVKDLDTLGVTLSSKGVRDYGVGLTRTNSIIAPILFPRTFGTRHMVIRNLSKVYFKEFYKIVPRDSKLINSIFLQLISSFGILQRELLGARNLGDGALKFSADDIELFLIVDDLSVDEKEIPLEEILNSRVDEYEDEVIKEYRMRIDKLIFDQLGLSQDEGDEVVSSVKSLCHDRMIKAGN